MISWWMHCMEKRDKAELMISSNREVQHTTQSAVTLLTPPALLKLQCTQQFLGRRLADVHPLSCTVLFVTMHSRLCRCLCLRIHVRCSTSQLDDIVESKGWKRVVARHFDAYTKLIEMADTAFATTGSDFSKSSTTPVDEGYNWNDHPYGGTKFASCLVLFPEGHCVGCVFGCHYADR
jgi:hypothetical protein